MRRTLLTSLLVWSAFALPARADLPETQIGSFTGDGSNSLSWTLSSSPNTGTLSGTTNGFFLFTNVPGLPAGFTGPLAATMTVSGGTDLSGFTANSQLNQPLDKPLTITVTQDGTGVNLLTATVTTGPPLLAGTGHTGAVIASQPTEDVTITSGVFSPSGQGAFTLSLGAITPALSFNPSVSNILNSFTASGSAVFSTAAAVPEPTSIALLGLGCVALFGARRRFTRISA
jgi:hypothetical protein